MLDIKLIREQPDRVQRDAEAKGYKVDIPKLLELDKQKRQLQRELEDLRELHNLNSELIALHKQIEKDEVILGPIIEELKKEEHVRQ